MILSKLNNKLFYILFPIIFGYMYFLTYAPVKITDDQLLIITMIITFFVISIPIVSFLEFNENVSIKSLNNKIVKNHVSKKEYDNFDYSYNDDEIPLEQNNESSKGWFFDLFESSGSSKQGFFEDNKNYRNRVYTEGKERITGQLSGSKPKQGFFEDDDVYRSRVAQESNEQIIKASTNSAPKQGFFEDKKNYQSRISNEANEKIVEASIGSKPTKGFFESNDDFKTRMSKEAKDIKSGNDNKGWFN